MTPIRTDARAIAVHGVVQGVGFRPFVHRLAVRHGLAGWVRNHAGTVEIHAEGDHGALDAFVRAIRDEAPPVARIDTLDAIGADATGAEGFRIMPSADAEGDRPVPPDVAICADCERELRDPANRRHRHAFITCTNCGPRYSVILALPYDRERTTMAAFPMCAACEAEYTAPGDRRFHAETIACPECGPHAWLENGEGRVIATHDRAIVTAGRLVAAGTILAARGVGGFHLACDASNDVAVARLRRRKHRDEKPLAVMVGTLAAARRIVDLSPAEESLLTSAERPIVLARLRAGARIATTVAPGLDRVGVMLAYTPLHLLLLEAAGCPLVMTSGNLSDEPIAIGNDEARLRLGGIADHFLLHDREILSRVDDSVVRLADHGTIVMRRARGMAPLPASLPIAAREPILAVGPHLKNTFTLARGRTAWVSPHIGDLDAPESVAHFQAALARYQELFHVAPAVVARDLHPEYRSTRIAADLGLPTVPVQHHHAHIAAVMAEHGIAEPVVGIALDGTGYGDDGNVWGAEVLVADLTGYRRAARLRYVPLPGGDAAARELWRIVLGYASLDAAARPQFARAFEGIPDLALTVAARQVERHLNAPLASSTGRLFDAAAVVLGVRRTARYEGQAAMELEALADDVAGGAPLALPVGVDNGVRVVDPLPLLVALAERVDGGDDRAALAAWFHDSVAAAVADEAVRAAADAGIGVVALGGGAFQNVRLTTVVRRTLEARGVRVLLPTRFGPNDAAVSYGQAAVAAATQAAR